MKTYPIYILPDGIVYPADKSDISHVEFWEESVARIVANLYDLPLYSILNIPYALRRARVVDDIVYYGEEQSEELLQRIRKALDNDNLHFAYDDHEKRLAVDVAQLRGLIVPGADL
jgi:hypothetical protein